MASTRTTFTLDDELTTRARGLNINISAATRSGVADTVRAAMIESDRAAYERHPERPGPVWDEARAWGNE